MALGVIGDDGEGFELIRGLDANGVDVDNLVVRPDRFTPTYTKPMAIAAGGPGRELNRLDIKNRASLPEAVEDQVIRRLRSVLPRVHAVLVSDQVQEENCGVITERVREEICSLARTYPSVVFAVDSRERIGLFEDVILKPNEREASRAVLGPAAGEAAGPDESLRCGEALYRRSGQPVFLTLGEKGMVAFHEGGPTWAPAVPVTGPLDIVGAGDSALSGIVAALSAGATVPEAAEIGCLAAGVTVRQIGTTGTASREQIAACLVEAGAGWGPAALPIA
jgi:bifunctional ADP-heptose synthase (sugar kinase/adenylyltransferase)